MGRFLFGWMYGFVTAYAIFGATGCTVALLGDARDDCERIQAASAAYEQRCSLAFRGRKDDCSDILIGASTSSSSADKCEATLAADPCTLRTLPSECRIEGI